MTLPRSMTPRHSPIHRPKPRVMLAALAVASVLTSSAWPQDVPATAPVTADAIAALPATAPSTAPTTTPAPQAATRPARNGVAHGGARLENGQLVLNFQDASIDVVLDELSALAGFIVVREVKPEGRVTVTSKQPLNADEAISLLNTVLRNAGYVAIRQERILKIVAADKAKRLNIPVRSGADPTKIANTDELITQVIPLRFADATQIRQDLQPLINPEADFTANASSNALVITDTSANVRRVVEILAALDTSLSNSVDVKVFQLKFATASSAAQLINSVFGNLSLTPERESPQRTGGGGGPGGRGGGPPPAPPQSREEAFQRFAQMQQQLARGGQQQTQGNKVSAAADDRTNSVVVAGPTDTLAVVAQVIKELDSNPAAEETVFVYRLRNSQALNIESVLNSLFNGTSTGTRGSTNNFQQQRQNTGAQRSSRTSGSTPFGSSGGFGGTSGTTGAGRLGTQTGAFAAQGAGGGQVRISGASQQMASELAGQVSIIADPDTNSLLVRASPTNFEKVKLVLEELDRPVQQVLIKVLIAEVTHENGSDIGTEFSILNLRPSGQGQEGGTSFNIPTVGPNATGLVVQVLESNVTATIRALETAGKLDVLSRPYILASDNQLASITVGQEVPFITNSRITDNGQTINTIEYGDVGILLDVVPHINPDGLVILDVAPEISTLTGTTVPISELVSAPVIAKRSAQSRVAARNGQTIVIGGLMEDRVTQSVDKVPLLGDIPLVGPYLFSRTRQNKSKTELLIFMTPHVAADPRVLPEMSQDEMGGTKLMPGAVGPGVLQEHMEGMKRGATPPVDRDQTPGEPQAPAKGEPRP